jgi:hypothetical protein
LEEALRVDDGLPTFDWSAISAWLETIEDNEAQAVAWSQAELAWLHHLQFALGPDYRIEQQESAVLLSSLEPNLARATLAFMCKTLARIGRVLDGVAKAPEWGHDILIVFDNQETYYRYVSRYYPEAGEFAASSGMHINHGCSHFVTVKADLRSVEPVIAHEMTHGCLSHLPIPAWLNEGLAVSTEQRLSPPPPAMFTPLQMHQKHMKFWGGDEIQEFWSGKSFLRNDDGNLLSYDLARILVSHFAAADWTAFASFVTAACIDDAGQAAANEHLGIELGAAVCAVLEREPLSEWSPAPERWRNAPERGAFRADASPMVNKKAMACGRASCSRHCR